MSKPGPKENLIPGQEFIINKMFYRDYMIEYFDEKVILLVDLLNDSKVYVKIISVFVFFVGFWSFWFCLCLCAFFLKNIFFFFF